MILQSVTKLVTSQCVILAHDFAKRYKAHDYAMRETSSWLCNAWNELMTLQMPPMRDTAHSLTMRKQNPMALQCVKLPMTLQCVKQTRHFAMRTEEAHYYKFEKQSPCLCNTWNGLWIGNAWNKPMNLQCLKEAGPWLCNARKKPIAMHDFTTHGKTPWLCTTWKRPWLSIQL